jgi:hypothetical protein
MKNEFVNQHPHTLGMSLYTMFKYILGNKTNKYLPLIVRELHEKSNDRFEGRYSDDYPRVYQEYMEIFGLEDTVLNSLSPKHKMVPQVFLQALSEMIDIRKIQEFDKLMEDNLIENPDITTYKNFSELTEQMNIAYTKKAIKEERKMVQVIMDTDEWFCVRPLTFSASVKYGGGTKWCTTMEKEPGHFKRYTKHGILIYLFNKVNSSKFGIHMTSKWVDSGRISIYNEADNRIDSSIARIPLEVMDQIFNVVGFDLDSDEVETNIQYIQRVHPEIYEQYWEKESLDEKISEVTMTVEEAMPDEFDVNNTILDEDVIVPTEFSLTAGHYHGLGDTEHFNGMVNTAQNSDTDEYVDYMIESVQERLKPKTIFHKWYRNIFYGGHEKLVLIGVPTHNHGIEAVKRTSEFFGEMEGYKTIFYPIYEGRDLVITQL